MESQNVNNLLVGLDKLDISKLSTNSTKKVVQLHKALTKEVELLRELQQKMLESYKVELVNGDYDWSNHDKSAEISKKINENFTAPVELPTTLLNFIEEDEFYESAKGSLNISEISYLETYLKVVS